MAKLIEFPPGEFPFEGSQDSSSRAKGWHVSDIILDWMWTLGMGFDPNKPVTEAQRRDWERGFRFEDALVVGYRGRFAPRPDPFCIGDIWMSPDGFIEDEGLDVEIKSTKKSLRKWRDWNGNGENPNFLYWYLQAKAYCYGLTALQMPGMKPVNRVRWHVFFVCGDYSQGAITPSEYDCSRGCEWEEHELAEWWQVILNHKAVMEKRRAEASDA